MTFRRQDALYFTSNKIASTICTESIRRHDETWNTNTNWNINNVPLFISQLINPLFSSLMGGVRNPIIYTRFREYVQFIEYIEDTHFCLFGPVQMFTPVLIIRSKYKFISLPLTDSSFTFILPLLSATF